MTELCGAVASVQIKKLPKILEHMKGSKNRIKAMLHDTPGLKFRRLIDSDGDTGPFIIIILENKSKALEAAEKMKKSGLHNVFRIADYGLHIYYHIPSLINKIPLSPAGNPWNLQENKNSCYDYNKGACPSSDDLFTRSVIIPVPSCLTENQEKDAADIISSAVTDNFSVCNQELNN